MTSSSLLTTQKSEKNEKNISSVMEIVSHFFYQFYQRLEIVAKMNPNRLADLSQKKAL